MEPQWVPFLWKPAPDEECLGCGHLLDEHENGHWHCLADVPGIVGTRPCTCTHARVRTRCTATLGPDQCLLQRHHDGEHMVNWGGIPSMWVDGQVGAQPDRAAV